MEFWTQIRPNNYRDLMLYWSQTCLGHVSEFGIWHPTWISLLDSCQLYGSLFPISEDH